LNDSDLREYLEGVEVRKSLKAERVRSQALLSALGAIACLGHDGLNHDAYDENCAACVAQKALREDWG